MAQDIPVEPSNPWYTLQVPLRESDGTVLTWDFEFLWDYRDKSWYFHLSRDNIIRMSGVRVVLGKYLGSRTRCDFTANSVLVAIDTAPVRGVSREAGFDDFGKRVILRRYSILEVILGRGFELGSPA